MLLESQVSLVLLVALVKSVAMVLLVSEDNKAFAKLTVNFFTLFLAIITIVVECKAPDEWAANVNNYAKLFQTTPAPWNKGPPPSRNDNAPAFKVKWRLFIKVFLTAISISFSSTNTSHVDFDNFSQILS